MSKPTGNQKPRGPAPIASFEDLSDEVRIRLESPEDNNLSGSVVRLPGIREDLSPVSPGNHPNQSKKISLIGSAVSATPKNVNVKPQTPRIDISRASSSSHHDSKDSSPDRDPYDPNGAKLGLGFIEDGALDLRSSTEELDFQEISNSGKKRPQSPSNLEDPMTARKDSQCSDIVLLSISGRTSRLSSIGSQGSNQSRVSNISHISILSEQSNLSRCSSPHKMQLETSFCGTKVVDKPVKENKNVEGKIETDVMEKILLSRKHDPTEAIFAEGISVEKVQSPDPTEVPAPREIPKITLVESASPRTNVKSRFLSESGVEYYYIPLKGPLPPDLPNTQKVPHSKKSTKQQHQPTDINDGKTSTAKKQEPKYIRIKLKPDKCYNENTHESSNNLRNTTEEISQTASMCSINKKLKEDEKEKSADVESIKSIKSADVESNKSIKSAVSTESMDRKSKSKSVLSLFKSKKSEASSKVTVNSKLNHNENGHVKQYYENPLQCASIRIPLHSPTYYENRPITREEPQAIKPAPVTISSRQNSTSSENITFSTNFGNENEVFVTKLPKNQEKVPIKDDINVETKLDMELTREEDNPLDSEIIEEKSVCSTIDDHNSSESERDVENKNNIHLSLLEPEKEAIVSQESFEDELPYVPTTLPLERSAALPILPIRQRSILEVKTCPIERPRSSTPLNPSCLNEYCEEFSNNITGNTEKIKILLPRSDRDVPPPLPPKGVHWISFDDIPEKRKVPKRIQTLPSHGYVEENPQECVVYNYVNPDECRCECHEISAKNKVKDTKESREVEEKYRADDELPLLGEEYPDVAACSGKVTVAEMDDPAKFLRDSTVISTSNNPQAVGETVPAFASELALSSSTSCITSQDEYQSPASPYLPRIY